MSRNAALGATAVVVLLAFVSLATAPVSGALMILTPAGTKVALKYLDLVDTAKTRAGDGVRFKVAADVIVEEHVVIKSGTEVTGTVSKTGHPFPQNAGFAVISGLAVTAVDKKAVALKDIRVSAKPFAGDVRVPAGALVTTGTTADATVRVP